MNNQTPFRTNLLKERKQALKNDIKDSIAFIIFIALMGIIIL